MRQPIIFDGRNQYDPKHIRAAGFAYYGIGRGEMSVAACKQAVCEQKEAVVV